MAHLQQDHPPAAARGGGGVARARLHCAHARHDQVLPVEDVVHGTTHQGHDGRRGHQAVEVHTYNICIQSRVRVLSQSLEIA